MSRLFPELADAPVAPTGDGSAAAEPTDAGPVDVEGSDACAAAFAAALRLPVQVVRATAMASGGVRFDTVSVEGERRCIFLVPPGEPAWKRTEGFGIVVEGSDLPPGLVEPLSAFARRYARAPLKAFHDRVLADPAPEPEPEPIAPEPGPPPPPEPPPRSVDPLAIQDDREAGALFYSYGTSTAWRTFFEEHDLHRGGCVRIGARVANVKHGDIECHHSLAPMTEFGISSFCGFRSDTETQIELNSMMVDVTLGDRDVIFGGDGVLTTMLEELARSSVEPEMVTLEPTCISLVIGDDMEVAADRARRNLGLNVVPLGCSDNPFRDALDAYLAGVERAPVAGHVQFAGLPRMAGFGAMARMLEAAGLRVPDPIVPDIPGDLVGAIARASVFVGLDLAGDRGQVDAAFARFPDVPVLRPPSPVGRAGSYECLRQIAATCEAADAFEAAWQQRCDAIEAEYADLYERATNYRLGFVVDQPAWRDRLAMRLGVPLLDLVLELGFAADVLAYAPGGAELDAPGNSRIRVVGYDSRESLSQAMRASRSALFFSDIRYDERITRSGKGSFSLEDVEVGLDGALGMLRRLVTRCEVPWFRRYGVLAGEVFRVSGAV